MFAECRTRWLQLAQSLMQPLQSQEKQPQRAVRVIADVQAFQGWRVETEELVPEVLRGRGDSFVLDFGEYIVGYFRFDARFVGAMDAPLRVKLTFAETPAETGESFDPYHGTLSRSWLQDEIITVDVLPQTIRLPRRYAFRFVKIEVIDTSPEFKVQFSNFCCEAVSCANWNNVSALPETLSSEARALDRVSLQTLAACMQTVFEDGPKRDRRLWIGDLRLQALAASVSFQNTKLVKRCLYLFAALAHENGLVSACVFETPQPQRGHCDILDYVALYVPTLLEYAQDSDDWETARDLWPVARRQLEGVLELVDEKGCFADPGNWWIFIDWQAELDKQVAMHGVILYCLRSGIQLAQRVGLEDETHAFQAAVARMTEAARREWLSPDLGLFVSGHERQVSWASQVWMILAEVVSPQEGAVLLQKLQESGDAVKPAGPYLYHYVVEALLRCGLAEDAKTLLLTYWGGMIAQGATTFWEVYDPQNPLLSPYNSHLVNSYCHA